MKKKLLKSIALTLSIVPMTALHAMNEQPNNNNNNQSVIQRAVNYAIGLDYKHMALYGAGFALSKPISTAAHELGHAAMAEVIKPGSVKHIEILSNPPHTEWDDINVSPAGKIAVSVAGPIAGALGSYAAAKGLQLICSYQKKKTLSEALKETHNASMLTSLSESPLISGLQYGFAGYYFWDSGLHNMTAFSSSDGLHTLTNIIHMLPNDSHQTAFQNFSTLKRVWNHTTAGIRLVAESDIDVQNYFTHLSKQISRCKLDGKKLVLSPSILSNMLLAQYYYDKDHFAVKDKLQLILNLISFFMAI